MNPQPPEYIGNLFAFLFMCVAVFYFINGMLSGNTINYDHFVIGYLDKEDHQSTTYIINNKSQQNPLIKDCIEALCALGMKKTEAKKRTLSIFNGSCPPVSIEEFLLIALKK